MISYVIGIDPVYLAPRLETKMRLRLGSSYTESLSWITESISLLSWISSPTHFEPTPIVTLMISPVLFKAGDSRGEQYDIPQIICRSVIFYGLHVPQ